MLTRYRKYRPALLAIVLLLAAALPTLAQSPADQEPPSLYQRLGGLMPISVVVSDFIDAVVPDPLLNANPAIDAARTRVPAPYLKYYVTAQVC